MTLIARAASASIALVAGLLLAAAPAVSAQTVALSAAPPVGQAATPAPAPPPQAASAQSAPGQNAGGIRGQVADPSGAVIPNANVVVLDSAGKTAGKATSDNGGVYAVHGLAPGTYSVWVTAQGFAAFRVPSIVVAAGQMKNVNPALTIQVEQQEVQVQAENTTISTAADANASAIVIKGEDLNALSDDPDELQNELQALAGPSAGPNGGQIYIDGFTGGQLPPKSSIREIRVNQNPFSAEYDRLGYGRIEIFTKPGTDKLHGQAEISGNDSAFNSQNPILFGKSEPSYSSWFLHGSVGGPINKNISWFASIFSRSQQNEAILEAIDPNSVTLVNGVATGNSLNEAIDNPSSRLSFSPRFDLHLGKANTLTVRYEYNRGVSTNGGLNALSLPSTAIDTNQQENQIQISDSLVLSPKLVDDIRFQYRRIRNNENPVSSGFNAQGQPLPSVTVQSAFTYGASNAQTVQDHENDFELQDYFSGAFGAHSLNFGGRARSYDDTNLSTSGSNGSYVFTNLGDYVGCVQPSSGQTCAPQQYSFTNAANPVAHAILYDGALFYQDDWKVSPRLSFSYGLRWETQNRINDKSDWAPRVAVAYALGRAAGKQQPKTVIRAGYGWFYQRFTVANGFGAQVPYVAQTIHLSADRKHETSVIVNAPTFFNPSAPYDPGTVSSGTGRNAPTFYSVSPNMKAANDMEAAVGVDRQLTKLMTGNVTYVYSQGIHQYFTDNLSAAETEIAAQSSFDDDEYPAAALTEPGSNNLQYQSGGFYREHQVMATLRASYRNFSFFTNYTFSNAHGDTSGVGSVPSASSDPGLDYGRTSFDVAHRVMVFGNVMFPWHISASPMLVANAGNPFNVTTGTDLTGNNQFNSRPTYAASCAEANTVQTYLGCFDLNPYGTGEKIVPYGLGTGPTNVSVNMRLGKTIGVGPKLGEGQHAAGGGGGGMHGGPPGLGGGGLSGSRGGPGRLDQAVNRKYTLNFTVWATNILNHENLGTPNGGLQSPFFGKSQSLAGGFFGPQSGGNRTINLQASFSF
ncbi:MAG TPA: carboxypeptidase regulatory-like domain-containing protein [Acidobacteriaceae bacterium]|jgi:hypothetical protein